MNTALRRHYFFREVDRAKRIVKRWGFHPDEYIGNNFVDYDGSIYPVQKGHTYYGTVARMAQVHCRPCSCDICIGRIGEHREAIENLRWQEQLEEAI